MIDVGAILRQLQAVIGQVAGAVQFVFVFALLAGGIVLYSALLTSFDERRYELAVMRALGAQRTQLRQAMLVELGVIGSVAGLMAAIGAMLLGRIVGQQAIGHRRWIAGGDHWLAGGAPVDRHATLAGLAQRRLKLDFGDIALALPLVADGLAHAVDQSKALTPDFCGRPGILPIF